MDKNLLKAITETCKKRDKEGDCPTVDAPGRETLEFALIDFERRLRFMQEECPPEFSKIIDEHFWELL